MSSDWYVHNAVLQLDVKHQRTDWTTAAHVGQLLTNNNKTNQFFLTCKHCVEILLSVSSTVNGTEFHNF